MSGFKIQRKGFRLIATYESTGKWTYMTFVEGISWRFTGKLSQRLWRLSPYRSLAGEP